MKTNNKCSRKSSTPRQVCKTGHDLPFPSQLPPFFPLPHRPLPPPPRPQTIKRNNSLWFSDKQVKNPRKKRKKKKKRNQEKKKRKEKEKRWNQCIIFFLFIKKKRKRKKRMDRRSNQRVVGKHQVVSNLINHYITDPPRWMLHSSAA